jgi:hypothetical protein
LVPIRISRDHVPCEGSLERDFVTVVSVEPEVTGIKAQPHTLHLRSGSAAVRYTPDFAIEREAPDDGGRRTTIVEVKPTEFAEEPEQEQRLRLVAAAYVHLGLTFTLVTESWIHEGCRLANAALIRRHVLTPVPDSLSRCIHFVLSTGAATTVGQCLASAAAEAAETAHLLALAYKGFLSIDLRSPIGPGTAVAWRRPAAPDAFAGIREATFAPREARIA